MIRICLKSYDPKYSIKKIMIILFGAIKRELCAIVQPVKLTVIGQTIHRPYSKLIIAIIGLAV